MQGMRYTLQDAELNPGDHIRARVERRYGYGRLLLAGVGTSDP